MRLQEKPIFGKAPVILEPFGHQVAGQASMLTVDSTTVCKPLIPREHHVYRTLPPQLAPFTPQYRGVIHVQLEEEDGGIRLLGYPMDMDDNQDVAENVDKERFQQLRGCGFSSGSSTPQSYGSEIDVPSVMEAEDGYQANTSSGSVTCVFQQKTHDGTACNHADADMVSAEHIRGCSTNDIQATTSSKCTTTVVPQVRVPSPHPSNPWGLSCHTRLLDKMRKSRLSKSGCPFLLLENVVAPFTYPCILDLKVGSRLHGDDATPKKIASQTLKCRTTTSHTLALRLCGMQVYQADTERYKSLDKYYGRTLTDSTFAATLQEFLHDGIHLRTEFLQPILQRLRDLVSCLRELDSFRFYASSLLIMYDGAVDCRSQAGAKLIPKKVKVPFLVSGENSVVSSDSTLVMSDSYHSSTSKEVQLGNEAASCRASLENCEMNKKSSLPAQPLVDVRMIDFAHTTHSAFTEDVMVHQGPDLDYIRGLENLISLFSQIRSEHL